MERDFHERLSFILDSRNIKNRDIERESGLHFTSVSNYRCGKQTPRMEFMYVLKKMVPDVNSNWLFFGEGKPFHDPENAEEPVEKEEPVASQVPVVQEKVNARVNAKKFTPGLVDKEPGSEMVSMKEQLQLVKSMIFSMEERLATLDEDQEGRISQSPVIELQAWYSLAG